MTSIYLRARACAGHALILWLAVLGDGALRPKTARATQPLADFIASAKAFNHELKQAQALHGQRHAEAQAARGKLLPSLDLSATYTRNAYKAELPAGPGGRLLTLIPYNQLEGSAAVTVPLIDIVSWARLRALTAQADAAHASAEQAELTLASQVVMRYFSLLGQEGLLQAALKRERVAQDNVNWVRTRLEAGTQSALDLARAQSDLAQAQQDVAAAHGQVQVSARALTTLTGMAPEPGATLEDTSLEPEATLDTWLARVGATLPPVRQAAAQERAAKAANRAAKWGYLPMLSAKASERGTNASALNGGHPTIWNVQANLTWHFDASLPASERAQRHAQVVAHEAALAATQNAADRIVQDHVQIEANRAKSAAARSQVEATRLGARWAQEKFHAGVITQLEVSQAQRDAFSAEASRIQADTDLLYYRALLRLDAGLAPDRLEEAP
jgi:outer membrane protein TolC